jgi:hypothetical protein
MGFVMEPVVAIVVSKIQVDVYRTNDLNIDTL